MATTHSIFCSASSRSLAAAFSDPVQSGLAPLEDSLPLRLRSLFLLFSTLSPPDLKVCTLGLRSHDIESYDIIEALHCFVSLYIFRTSKYSGWVDTSVRHGFVGQKKKRSNALFPKRSHSSHSLLPLPQVAFMERKKTALSLQTR